VKLDIQTYVYDQINRKSEKAKANNYIQGLYEEYAKRDKKGEKLIKVAVFSDLHIDFKYTPGNSNDCGRPICCRIDSGLP